MGADWSSAIAAICAAVAAFLSLRVAQTAKAIQERSADFANCIDVTVRLAEAQRRVRTELVKKQNAEEDSSGYEFEFGELLNLLEALALLHNDDKLAPSTKKLTRMFLEEVIGWIRIDDGMKQFMQRSMTGPDTYKELTKFEKSRNKSIRGISGIYSDNRDLWNE